MKPWVGVIIPTYNRAHLVSEAVRSVLEQTFVDWELVVVDDGSTDNTAQVISTCSDSRLNYIYQENQGGSAARNRGRQVTNAPYLLFLDSDDILLLDALEAFWKKARVLPDACVIGGGYQCIDKEGEVLTEKRFWESDGCLGLERWLFTCPFIPSASLIRCDCFDMVGGFDVEQPAAQDWDLWLRLAAAGCSMSWLKRAVCQYRLHPQNLSADFELHHTARIRALDKIFDQPGLLPDIVALRSQACAHSCLKLMIQEFAVQQSEAARESLRRAVEMAPELLNDRSQVIFEKIVSFARRPLEANPLEYVRGAFDHLPAELTSLRRRRREALGTVAMSLVFSAALQENWSVVRRYWRRGVYYQPHWLCNRGVWSILITATIGVWAEWLWALCQGALRFGSSGQKDKGNT